MASTERNLIYIKVLNKLTDLLNGKRKEVRITLYELSELDFINFYYDVDGNFVKLNNYADILREFCKGHNIRQTEDIENCGYVFRLEGKK